MLSATSAKAETEIATSKKKLVDEGGSATGRGGTMHIPTTSKASLLSSQVRAVI